MEEHSRWQVGDEKNIDLQSDNWLGCKIKDLHLVLPKDIQFMQTSKIDSIMQEINQKIPHDLSILTPQIVEDILKINLSFDNTTIDKLIWKEFVNDDLYFKDVYNCIKRDHIYLS